LLINFVTLPDLEIYDIALGYGHAYFVVLMCGAETPRTTMVEWQSTPIQSGTQPFSAPSPAQKSH